MMRSIAKGGRGAVSRLLPLLALACAAIAAPPPTWAEDAATPPPRPIIIAHMFAKDSLPDRAAALLAERLAASGAFGKVEIAPSGRLGDERENLRQLQKGDIEIAVVGDLVLSYLIPKYQTVNMPFTHRSAKEAMAVYNSDLGDEIRHDLNEFGLEVLSWHCIGTRLLTANRPIRSLDDLKGLELRLPPDTSWIATWEALGATPRSVAFTQLYDALKRGTVQAQENPPNLIKAGKFHEVQSHLMMTRHVVQRQFILAARTYYDGLDAAARETLRDAAREASRRTCETAEQEEAAVIDWLTSEGGMTRVDLDLFATAAPLLPGIAEKLDGARGAALLARIDKIQKDAP